MYLSRKFCEHGPHRKKEMISNRHPLLPSSFHPLPSPKSFVNVSTSDQSHILEVTPSFLDITDVLCCNCVSRSKKVWIGFFLNLHLVDYYYYYYYYFWINFRGVVDLNLPFPFLCDLFLGLERKGVADLLFLSFSPEFIKMASPRTLESCLCVSELWLGREIESCVASARVL